MPRRPGSVTHWPSENWDCAVLFGRAFQPKDRNTQQIEIISDLLLKSHDGMLRAVGLPRGAFLPAGSSWCSATGPWCYLVHLHLGDQGHFCFLTAKYLLRSFWSSLIMKLFMSIGMEVALLLQLLPKGILPPKLPTWLWINWLASLVLLFSRI